MAQETEVSQRCQKAEHVTLTGLWTLAIVSLT